VLLGAASVITRQEFDTLRARVEALEKKVENLERQLESTPAQATQPQARETTTTEADTEQFADVPVNPNLWHSYYRAEGEWTRRDDGTLATRARQGVQLKCKEEVEALWLHATGIEGDFEATATVYCRRGGDAAAHFGLYRMGVNHAWISLPEGKWCNVLIKREGNDIKAFIDDQETPVDGPAWCKGNLCFGLRQGDIMLIREIAIKTAVAPPGRSIRE